MNDVQLSHPKPFTLVSVAYALLLLALLLFGGSVFAAAENENIAADGEITVEPIEPLSAEELSELVAPIALYPDDLLAIVLPAATYPVQIVQAARFLEAREDDPDLEPDEDWDDAIIALLNYPEIIALLNEDLDWTWQLGEAVLVQEAELIAAVSDFRERARVAGNLKSDEHQIVVVDDEGAIEIRPADPEVIYVPYYEPERVTVYQRYPVYHYYPQGYPLYYYPYPRDYYFSTGHFWGVTSAFSIGWNTHRLHLHHYGFDGHPYYDDSYYDPFYYRFPHLWLSFDYHGHYSHHRSRDHHRHHRGNQWQPDRVRAGARPRDPGRERRDWRDERIEEPVRGNRRREHVVAQRRSLEAEQRQAGTRGSRLITSGTELDGVPRARNDFTTTRSDRRRVNARTVERRTAGVNRRADDTRRTALTADDTGRGVGRRMERVVRNESRVRRSTENVRSQSRARGTRIERNTLAPEVRVESRRRTTITTADVRPPRAERARLQARIPQAQRPQARAPQARAPQARAQPARVQAPVVRQERASAPAKVRQQSRESRSSNNNGSQRRSSGRSSGNQRSHRNANNRRDH